MPDSRHLSSLSLLRNHKLRYNVLKSNTQAKFLCFYMLARTYTAPTIARCCLSDHTGEPYETRQHNIADILLTTHISPVCRV